VLTRVARVTGWIFRVLALSAMLLLALAVEGLFFYTSDLPNIEELREFSSKAPTAIADASICGERANVVAIPTSSLIEVRNGLLAAEGDVDPRNMMRRLYDHFLGGVRAGNRYGTYSLQVSRQMLCGDHRSKRKRELAELRTSIQLERRFTTNQLLDIYLNRACFGPGVYGIEKASEYYFAKPTMQLSSAEAALLVGLIRSPDYFSPVSHPDRALARRNEVIDAMAKRGSISSEQAEQAKKMPLGTVAKDRVKPGS
jgi:membrane carboxypeptidase/penicillin-binding protein